MWRIPIRAARRAEAEELPKGRKQISELRNNILAGN